MQEYLLQWESEDAAMVNRQHRMFPMLMSEVLKCRPPNVTLGANTR